MFALIPGAANECLDRGVTHRGGEAVDGGVGGGERDCRNSRRGSSFQPQVSFCYLDYI